MSVFWKKMENVIRGKNVKLMIVIIVIMIMKRNLKNVIYVLKIMLYKYQILSMYVLKTMKKQQIVDF